VRGVEAYAQPLGRFDHLDDRCQMLQPIPQRAPLPGRDLQAGDRARLGHGVVNDVERPGDLLQPRLLPRAHVAAGMRDEVRDAERFASPKLLRERFDALFPQLGIRRAEIDQIGIVRDGLFELQPSRVRLPPLHLGRVERGGAPLPLVGGKHLHSIHAEPLGIEQRLVHTAGDGEMRTEH
jgi:hypothetical protein